MFLIRSEHDLLVTTVKRMIIFKPGLPTYWWYLKATCVIFGRKCDTTGYIFNVTADVSLSGDGILIPEAQFQDNKLNLFSVM